MQLQRGRLRTLCLQRLTATRFFLPKKIDMSWQATLLFSAFITTTREQKCDGNAAREESRITSACLGALNAFLLANGLDMAAGAVRLHAAARPLLGRCWGARSRDARLRDCLVTYLHIQARLLDRLVGPCGCSWCITRSCGSWLRVCLVHACTSRRACWAAW